VSTHSVPIKEDLVRRYGLWEKCASVRALVGSCCAGLSGLEKEIERRVGVPVVDGVACAVVLVEFTHFRCLRRG
jgi:Asp/Glu/hydantoin racemase